MDFALGFGGFAVFFLKDFYWVPIGSIVEFLLSFDVAVRVEVEDVSIAKEAWVSLRFEFAFELFPEA